LPEPDDVPLFQRCESFYRLWRATNSREAVLVCRRDGDPVQGVLREILAEQTGVPRLGTVLFTMARSCSGPTLRCSAPMCSSTAPPVSG
jgi:hypothetical protein